MSLAVDKLQQLLEAAARSAKGGDHSQAAESYQAALGVIQNPFTALAFDQRANLIRSIAFNLAQSLNKLGQFQHALDQIELGLRQNPTDASKAISLAAKGEALLGLQRPVEGLKTFEEAVRYHPVIGPLNSADAMVCLGNPSLVLLAGEWVDTVVATCGDQLNDSLNAEVSCIRQQIVRRKTPPPPSVRSDDATTLIERAKQPARTHGELREAADLMEEALTKSPNLRDRYESSLQLWRKGITM